MTPAIQRLVDAVGIWAGMIHNEPLFPGTDTLNKWTAKLNDAALEVKAAHLDAARELDEFEHANKVG